MEPEFFSFSNTPDLERRRNVYILTTIDIGKDSISTQTLTQEEIKRKAHKVLSEEDLKSLAEIERWSFWGFLS